MPLHKPGSLANAKKTLQDGAKQLFKRSNWVAENWADILNLLGLESTKRIVMTPLLVTRRYVAPDLISDCTVVPLRMLEVVLSRIAHGKLQPRDGLAALPRIVLRS